MNWLTSLFNKFIRIFKSFITDAFPIVKQIIIGQLLPFALEVVKKLEATDLSNIDRRKEAFESIRDQARVKGIEVGTSLIFLIIELAIQKMKAEK